MAKLGWTDIRKRATAFSKKWEEAKDERSEAQSFWNDFFAVFGIERQKVALFERPVKTIKGTYGFIDLFWPSVLLAEHKSRGASLDKAASQAEQYCRDLLNEDRRLDTPRYIILSDFQRVVLHDLAPEDPELERVEFPLTEFDKHVQRFGFMIGQQTHKFKEEDPANLEAAQIMADLHDAFEAGGYPKHELERFLVRILFCLFSDDTGIFDKGQFQLFIENNTAEDGEDLGGQLGSLFDVLNTPKDKRQKKLPPDLSAFEYINGDLFAERLTLAGFDRDMRNRLVAATRFDWSRISPAIFGSLFQGIMEPAERRQIGAHYTSERDILKVIRPLFLDELTAEFEQIKSDRSTRRIARLLDFQKKLAKLRFLDPACGCGNFLVIAYRELRRLELEALKLLPDAEKGLLELHHIGEEYKRSQVDVHQFYGIDVAPQ